jgi:acyl-CoA hydrolase
LYDYVDRNPLIELRPVDYTNAVRVIAQISNMVAINAATEVDLMGQVVADSVGKKVFSGVGGQQDFLRGAEESPGGKPIIALPATAKGGTVSRISAVLAPGTPVTTTRNEVHFIVTEFGIADLFGQCLNERAVWLIDIAHPDFRRRLYEEYLEYQRSCGMEEGLQEYMERHQYSRDWAIL